MKRLLVLGALVMLSVSAIAQRNETTFTGTAYIYGSGLNTRNISRNFTMRLTGQTSPGDASRLISILQESGQNALLRELEGQKVGTFALGGQVGRDINAAEVTKVTGGCVSAPSLPAGWGSENCEVGIGR